jgi:restriction endonuclease S subunit
MTLKEIATIGAGQTFRDKAESANSDSAIRLLQIKDIREGRFSNADTLPFANLDPSALRVKLRQGEILLPLRGGRSEAMLFDISDTSQIATTTNQVAIIYPYSDLVIPEFLLWYLNSSHGKQIIFSKKTGSTILQLSTKTLADLTIDVPPLAVQSKIAEIYENWQQQKNVLNELISNGEVLVERLCFEKIANAGSAI